MNPHRPVELDVEIGADARNWSAIQAAEKLKPVETELRRIEELVAEIVTEMEYLRAREHKLRDTNESTNERVKWFAFMTMGMLVALGGWQVVYLRAYFRLVNPAISHGRSGLTFSAGRSILSRVWVEEVRRERLRPCSYYHRYNHICGADAGQVRNEYKTTPSVEPSLHAMNGL